MADTITPESRAAVIVSVVVPTRNRREMLRDCLEALFRQTLDHERYEIIVVDNLSTDSTAQMIAEMQKTAPCDLHFHVMPVNRGPAPSRNQGARMARGEFVAYTDSDCRPHPDWLKNALAAFDEETAFVTGSVLNKPEQRPKFFSKCLAETTRENVTYPTANAVYRKKVFWEMGGMDENLCFADIRGVATECADTDLAWRIRAAGGKNRFAGEAIVYHEIEDLSFVDWAMQPLRLYVVPALVGKHAGLRDRLMHFHFFLFRENAFFLMSLLGIALASLVSRPYLLLTIPYMIWLAGLFRSYLRASRLPKLLPQAVLVVFRQAVMMAALIYGSVRFRTLVL